MSDMNEFTCFPTPNSNKRKRDDDHAQTIDGETKITCSAIDSTYDDMIINQLDMERENNCAFSLWFPRSLEFKKWVNDLSRIIGFCTFRTDIKKSLLLVNTVNTQCSAVIEAKICVIIRDIDNEYGTMLTDDDDDKSSYNDKIFKVDLKDLCFFLNVFASNNQLVAIKQIENILVMSVIDPTNANEKTEAVLPLSEHINKGYEVFLNSGTIAYDYTIDMDPEPLKKLINLCTMSRTIYETRSINIKIFEEKLQNNNNNESVFFFQIKCSTKTGSEFSKIYRCDNEARNADKSTGYHIKVSNQSQSIEKLKYGIHNIENLCNTVFDYIFPVYHLEKIINSITSRTITIDLCSENGLLHINNHIGENAEIQYIIAPLISDDE